MNQIADRWRDKSCRTNDPPPWPAPTLATVQETSICPPETPVAGGAGVGNRQVGTGDRKRQGEDVVGLVAFQLLVRRSGEEVVGVRDKQQEPAADRWVGKGHVLRARVAASRLKGDTAVVIGEELRVLLMRPNFWTGSAGWCEAAGGGNTLADLYDPLAMPAKLVKAHAALDRAADRCYRAQPFASDRQRVEFLFGLYEQLSRSIAR